MIKIFIVDDHSMVIEGIYALLQHEKEMKIIGHATNAAACFAFFKTTTADVILMDISLPDKNGVDLCAAIKNTYPGIMVLALSTFNEGTYVKKMMEAGASGYLLKNAEKQEIIEAIKMVAMGKIYLSFDAAQAQFAHQKQQAQIPKLTKREKEVLTAIAEGLTNITIAQKLFISIDTVETHRKNLHTKLQVKNAAMLVKVAGEYGLL
jgi:DNA-binding NarL/FixJ family response regulator